MSFQISCFAKGDEELDGREYLLRLPGFGCFAKQVDSAPAIADPTRGAGNDAFCVAEVLGNATGWYV
jgi:hypothetical protein